MQVFITFDVEVWCNGWNDLDKIFPKQFERYIYGKSESGEYALPKTLEILSKHDLKGVFFVEPLFAARFGSQYLRTIVSMIQDAGQEVQMHLHPEWSDEIRPPIMENISNKRQYLYRYTLAEQTQMIGLGLLLLREAGATGVSAFRAGGFAANRDTFRALAANQLWIDSSIDAALPESVIDLRGSINPYHPLQLDGVNVYPMTVFQDGTGRERHAQIGACSHAEIIQALTSAKNLGYDYFMMLSHSFEMLKPSSHKPDWVVARRFNKICEFLSNHRDEFPAAGIASCPPIQDTHPKPLAKVGRIPTLRRFLEQAYRRL